MKLLLVASALILAVGCAPKKNPERVASISPVPDLRPPGISGGPEDILIMNPGRPPDGVRWPADDKLDEIEFEEQPVWNILRSLSDGFGLKISVPRAVYTRVLTIRMKNATYRDIISAALKNTQYEADFSYPNVVIKRIDTPNSEGRVTR